MVTNNATLKKQLLALTAGRVKVRDGRGCKVGSIEVFLPAAVRLNPGRLAQVEAAIHAATGRTNKLAAFDRTPTDRAYFIQPLSEEPEALPAKGIRLVG